MLKKEQINILNESYKERLLNNFNLYNNFEIMNNFIDSDKRNLKSKSHNYRKKISK